MLGQNKETRQGFQEKDKWILVKSFKLKPDRLKQLPIWAFHGDQDDQVPVDKTRSMVKAIEDAGGSLVKYTELPGEGHLIAGGVYARSDLPVWMFEQKRSAP